MNLENAIGQTTGNQVRVFTIHGAFFFGPGMANLAPSTSIPDRQVLAFQKARYLVIDEISMVRADLLDRMDLTLRSIRGSSELFGGLKVIMVGDPCQLPPVVPSVDAQPLRLLYGEDCPQGYFFQSKAFGQMIDQSLLTVYELSQNHRQVDLPLNKALASLRMGIPDPVSLALINSRVGEAPSQPEKVLHLTSDNASASEINRRYLDACALGPGHLMNPTVHVLDEHHRTLVHSHPMATPLDLRPGGRILFTRNNPDGTWKNGSRGTVLEILGDTVVVEVDGNPGSRVFVEKKYFEIIVPDVDPVSGLISPRVVGCIQQYPLLGGYAITVHRSQSLTLDQVVVGLGRGGSSPGLAYTSLSRVRTLGGLYLNGPALPYHFDLDPAIRRFLAMIQRFIRPVYLLPSNTE
jgi:hypothetical protein